MKTISGIIRFRKNEDSKVVEFPRRFFVTSPLVKTITNNNSFVLVQRVTNKNFIIINTSGSPTTVYFSAVSRPVNFNINDLDQDGIEDNLDLDRDGDGVNNDVDLFPDNPLESSDTDGDGIGDNSDIDADNDGLSNTLEQTLGSNPLSTDTDNDGLSDSDEYNVHNTSLTSSDTDNDGYSDSEEINLGTDPLDENSFPQIQTTSTLYFALTSNNTYYHDNDFISIYSGEMFNLEYPQITDLQPDSGGNTQYEIITPDDSTIKNNLESYRIFGLNSNDYNNTDPKSAIFKLENINKNQTYVIFALNDNSPPGANDPTTSMNITMAASNDSNEDANTILANKVDKSLFAYAGNEDQFIKYFWYHAFSIDNNNNISFSSSLTQEAGFYDEASAYLMIHSNYTQNSNGTDPNVEIAIQSINYDADADINNYAGYVSQFDYTIQDIDNQEDAFVTNSNLNYSSISLNLSNDDNLNNQARVAAQVGARQKYRIHLKVGADTDCDFNVSLKTVGMLEYFMTYNGSLEDYNATYNSNSNLTYHNLIPDDNNNAYRIYYYYFTVREDGFIIWES